MTTIHIKATDDTENQVISDLINVLSANGFKTEKYLSIHHKIIMAKKELKK